MPSVGQRLDHRVERAPRAARPRCWRRAAGRHLGEADGLLVLAAQRLDDERAVEALVRDLGDVGAQLLGAGHARRHPALEDDVESRTGRGRRPGRSAPGPSRRGAPWTSATTSMTTTPRAIGSGANDVPGRLDVGVGVGQQLAGRVAVVPGQRQPEVLTGDPAAVRRAEVVEGDAAATRRTTMPMTLSRTTPIITSPARHSGPALTCRRPQPARRPRR